MQRYWSDFNVLWTPRLSFASFPRKVTHILSKYVGQYVGLNLIFFTKTGMLDVMTYLQMSLHPPQRATICIFLIFEEISYPTPQPSPPAPLCPQPPAPAPDGYKNSEEIDTKYVPGAIYFWL